MDKLLTMDDVAELCALDRRTVQRWIKRGDLPYIKLGRSIRVDPKDLRTLLERQKRTDEAAKQTKQEAGNGAVKGSPVTA